MSLLPDPHQSGRSTKAVFLPQGFYLYLDFICLEKQIMQLYCELTPISICGSLTNYIKYSALMEKNISSM